jgi:putative transposase
MSSVVISLLLTLRSSVRSRARLHLETLALRHQLYVLERSRPRRVPLSSADRVLWVWLSRVWRDWRAVVIVKPDDPRVWRGFRLVWTWKSRRRGRPTVAAEVRTLIRTMSDANPLWGAPRIHGELLKLGVTIRQAAVARYMVRRRRPPSQTWRTFLANHVTQIMTADFFVLPTITYRLLFVLVILAHDRRRVVHVAVIAHPTALDRRNNSARPFPKIMRLAVSSTIGMARSQPSEPRQTVWGIQEVCTAPRSPCQNAYVERVIGSGASARIMWSS